MILQLAWDDQWTGYDDEITIAMKTKWADEHCLGGTVAWSIDFNSGSGSGDTPLIPSTNGTCGEGTGQVCLDSKFGNCCSKNGFCRKTDAFCLPEKGCQLEYGICVQENAAGIRASADGTCGNKSTCIGSGFGICCSSGGNCGSDDSYCSPGKGCQPNFGTCYDHPKTDMFVSVDGTCGGNTTCIGSAFGECCSQYSYCGSGADWCDSALNCQPLFGICH